MKKTILLSRVSTDEQVGALSAQTSRLKSYADHNNLPNCELHEFDETAYKEERLKFKEIIEQIKTSDDETIICCDKIDRLIRNFTSELITLEDLRRTGKIELHFPADNIVLTKDSPASDLFRFTIGVSLAKYYSDSISDNVKRKNEQKLRDGELPGPAPFGYENVEIEKGNKSIVIKPYEAEAVKSLFSWYASEVFSLSQLRKKLLKEYGFTLSRSQLHKLLQNPFYYGEIKRKEKLYPHKYGALITHSQFKKVQEIMASYEKKQYKYAGLPFAYRGLMRCAYCGCSITPERTKGYHYYHCTQFNGKHGAQYIREEDITVQMEAILTNIQIPDSVLEQCLEVMKSSHDAKKSHQDTLRADIEAEYTRVQNRLEKMYDDKLDGLIEQDMYERKYNEYRGKQSTLKDKLDSLETADNDYYLNAEYLLKLVNKAPTLFKKADPEQKRQLLKFVLQNLELDGKKLLYKLKTPFDLFEECSKNQTWLPVTVWNPNTGVKRDK